MKRKCVSVLIFCVFLLLLSGCGQTRHTGTAGNFKVLPVQAEPGPELSEEDRFNMENKDEYLMWFNGGVIDLREINPADYYATDEIMHRYRELFSFDAERILYDTPDSSCFSRIGYDYSREMLALEFRDSGNLYVYYDFSAVDWEQFSTAESLGKHYNANIKDEYDYEKWN